MTVGPWGRFSRDWGPESVGIIGGMMSLSPIDVWPILNTSSFELLPGAEEVPPDHPAFLNCREAGPIPGSEGLFSNKEIFTRIYKAVVAPLTPIP